MFKFKTNLFRTDSVEVPGTNIKKPDPKTPKIMAFSAENTNTPPEITTKVTNYTKANLTNTVTACSELRAAQLNALNKDVRTSLEVNSVAQASNMQGIK